MATNLDRFKSDLKALIHTGKLLICSMEYEFTRDRFLAAYKKAFKTDKELQGFIDKLPNLKSDYQKWYSESLAVLRQILPDRVGDFIRLYEKPKSRKEITYENYRIEDALQGLTITRGWEKVKVVGEDAAHPLIRQQLAMLEAAERRFESSLFEIRQVVQADLYDSELETAEALLKNKLLRASGAVAGVVLEGHLAQVCSDRGLTPAKKNPTIGDFNEALKAAGVIDVPQWRFIQHLADIRNICDHSRKPEPVDDQVESLVAGVKKIIKSVF